VLTADDDEGIEPTDGDSAMHGNRTTGFLLLALHLTSSAVATSGPIHKEFLSPVHFVDQKYRSMEGPMTSQTVVLAEGKERELLWLTGFETRMVGVDGKTGMSDEFLCHTNLELNPKTHHEILGLPMRNFSRRVFTNSQGQMMVRFPDGFGLPVASTEPLRIQAQVVNHNRTGPDLPIEVRHKLTLDYVRDRELQGSMKPLYQATAIGMVSLEGEKAYVGTRMPNVHQEGASCMPGEIAGSGMAHKNFMRDSLGQKFAGHWVVKPGRAEWRTLVTEPLALEFDTTIHFIAVHIHPFAEYVELRDLTDGRTLFRSKARGPEGRIGLEQVDYLSSAEGVPIFKAHDYELITVYNNTTGVDQDSMSVMFLYLLDKKFDATAVRASLAR
jgi:hypothetical protein